MKLRFLMPLLIFENHSYGQIAGNSAAPYLNALVGDSKTALFTRSYALTAPSQPNYLMLFSGSDQGVTNDNIPKNLPFDSPNLGAGLLQAGRTFSGYSEDLPETGFEGAHSGFYARKHNPWVNWQGSETNGIPEALNLPMTSFPSNFESLPTVSFVIPNLVNDMHDGTDPERIFKADAWLKDNLDAYVQWAQSHNSLFVITFDEGQAWEGSFFNRIISFFQDENKVGNRESKHIFTAFVGEMVKPGSYDQKIDHYSVLRTVEEMYGLSYSGSSADSLAIRNVWK